MSPPLNRVQSALGANVRGAIGDRHLDAWIAVDALRPEQRLQIYGNHYAVTLKDALLETFPVVARLVGETFFAMAARRFIRIAPPSSPCLFEYGHDFPSFLDGMPEAAALPYLGDVARFEWAINAAYHAEDVPALDPDALRRIDPGRQGDLVFVMHPACQLVSSAYPVLRIWRTNQAGAADEPPVSLTEGRSRLVVLRSGTDVVWRTLTPAEFVFLYALHVGRSLEEAFASATAADSRLDLTGTLTALLDHGAVVGFILPPTSNAR